MLCVYIMFVCKMGGDEDDIFLVLRNNYEVYPSSLFVIVYTFKLLEILGWCSAFLFHCFRLQVFKSVQI